VRRNLLVREALVMERTRGIEGIMHHCWFSICSSGTQTAAGCTKELRQTCTLGILPRMRATLHKSLLVLACVASASLGLGQNHPATGSSSPLATVDGQPIYDSDLAPTSQGQILSLRNQEYEIKKKALDDAIGKKLVEAVAKKQGIASEKLLQEHVDAKIAEPTDAELQAYYLAIKNQVNGPFDHVKEQIRSVLKQGKIQQARQDYMASLRKQVVVAVLMQPPRIQVGYDPVRVRGNPNAPVLIVEFSDYQCPYCHQVESTLTEILAKYGDKISLAYRDFPLEKIHPQAEIAAEASRCALEQGKFWAYHDRLFSASELDKNSLIEYARNLMLDDKQFASCLTNEKYKAEINKDVEEGTQAGVTRTPSFFINGIQASGVLPREEFVRLIDEELAQKH
jgi:protein-disulfide isomerase